MKALTLFVLLLGSTAPAADTRNTVTAARLVRENEVIHSSWKSRVWHFIKYGTNKGPVAMPTALQASHEKPASALCFYGCESLSPQPK